MEPRQKITYLREFPFPFPWLKLLKRLAKLCEKQRCCFLFSFCWKLFLTEGLTCQSSRQLLWIPMGFALGALENLCVVQDPISTRESNHQRKMVLSEPHWKRAVSKPLLSLTLTQNKKIFSPETIHSWTDWLSTFRTEENNDKANIK